MGRGLFYSLFLAVMLVLGACASKSDETTTAATDGTHQCAADCKHDGNHQCGSECKHDKNHACNCKGHQCGADCKAHKSAKAEGGCDMHANHDHEHSATCGHKTVKHGDHMDYLHDGHQHAIHGDHVDEHKSKKAETTKKTEKKS